MKKKLYYNIRDSYKEYKKEYSNPVSLNIYLDIVHSFLKFLIRKIINGYHVNLPGRMGTMKIRGKKHKPIINKETGEITGLPLDYKSTVELWNKRPDLKKMKQYVFFTNDHTSGVTYKCVWIKKNAAIQNKFIYSFRLTRKNKRDTSKGIQEGKEYEIETKNK